MGHALGALHEHQSPRSEIKWNVEAVLAFYQGILSRYVSLANCFCGKEGDKGEIMARDWREREKGERGERREKVMREGGERSMREER